MEWGDGRKIRLSIRQKLNAASDKFIEDGNYSKEGARRLRRENRLQNDAVSRVVASQIMYLASYTGKSADELLKSRAFDIIADTTSTGGFIRTESGELERDEFGNYRETNGDFVFTPEKKDKFGKVVDHARNIIYFYRGHNISTMIHEPEHFFLQVMRDLFRDEQLTGRAKQDWDTIAKYLEIEDVDFKLLAQDRRTLTPEQQAKWDKYRSRWIAAQGKFATSGEKFIMLGQAPKLKLRRAFEILKRYMGRVYGSVGRVQIDEFGMPQLDEDGKPHVTTVDDAIQYVGADRQWQSYTMTPEAMEFMSKLYSGTPKERKAKASSSESTSGTGETYHQPLNRDVDLDGNVRVIHITPTLENVPFWQRIRAFGKDRQAEIIRRFADGGVVNEHTGLTIALTKHGLNHILNTTQTNDNLGGQIVYQAIPYLDVLAREAYRVETHEDYKPSASKVQGQSGNLKQVHRFLVPVEFDGEQHILKLTAKEYETGKAEVDEISLYDMKYTKKMPSHPSTNSPNLMGRAARTLGSLDVVSVRDMLRDVNDVEGNPYLGADETYHQSKRIRRSNDSFITQQDIERFEQLVYHWTGHIILGNKFDLRYIGTGEGTQAFGWGLYFAENKKVSQTYRHEGMDEVEKKLVSITTKDGSTYYPSKSGDWSNIKSSALSFVCQEIQSRLLDDPELSPYQVLDELDDAWGYDLDYYKDELEDALNSRTENGRAKSGLTRTGKSRDYVYSDKEIEELQDEVRKHQAVVDAINSIDSIITDPNLNGNLYKVDIPENDVLLNLDASLEEQPIKVQKAIRKITALFDTDGLNNAKTGEEFYNALEKAMVSVIQHKKLHSKKLGTINRADMAASLILNQAGIPGLRFLDQFSRDSGEGTHNFVIWNTDMIQVLGLTEDSDTDAKQYFERTKKLKDGLAAADIEAYHQVIRSADDLDYSLKIAQSQLDAVRRKYEGTEAWLKALNGKPSNLTEKQWLQVRTPNFKL